jgi:nucleotide-binding universal stress UspA family protein
MEARKVLFPLDLSEFCSQIVPQVISVAQKFNSEVHLVTVVELQQQPDAAYVQHPSLDKLREEIQERVERQLRQFEEEFFLTYRSVRRMVLSGLPAAEILRYIETARIDLVVMATHRRREIAKAMLGSVADEVIRKSPVPVMSINPWEAELGWRVSNIKPEEELRLRPKW